jgi:hypothetical protein
MRHQRRPPAGGLARLLATVAAGTCITVSGCGGGASAGSGATPGTPGHPTGPAAASSSPAAPPASAGSTTRQAHLTGNLCADATALNSEIRALTEALITDPGTRQQRAGTLLATVSADTAALASEAPGPLQGAFSTVARFYRTAENKLANGGGQLTLADLEPGSRSGLAPATRQIDSYLSNHCAA